MDINPRKLLALALIIALLVFLIVALLPYLSAVFGAIILYVLFNPLYHWLRKKRWSKQWAALTVIICTILIVLIPLFVVFSIVLGEVPQVVEGARNIVDNIGTLDRYVANVDLEQMAQETLTKIGSFAQGLIVEGIGRATHMLIGVTIMFFLLYFMLVNHRDLAEATKNIMPFNAKNTKRLWTEAGRITKTVVFSTGVIAAGQGLAVALAFYVIGIPGAMLWGIVAGVLSFLPVVGTPLVWGPAAIVLLVQGRYVAGIGLLIWGAILSNADNFIRPMLQKRMSEMHPLISVVGVFIGIPYFGLIGLIVGPLILSYLVLTIEMFREEYL